MMDDQVLSASEHTSRWNCPGPGWPSVVAVMLEAATPDDAGSGPRQLEQPTSNVRGQDTPRTGSPTQRSQQTRRLSGDPDKRTCIEVERSWLYRAGMYIPTDSPFVIWLVCTSLLIHPS